MNTLLNADKWFQNLGSNRAARLRLFCFPYAGGNASIFRTWSRELPANLEICPVQLPGRENRFREAPFTDFEELVATLSEAIRPYLDLPFAFFGHSLGGLVSFEVARRLRQAGVASPRHLFISASAAPQFRVIERDDYRLPRNQFIEKLRQLGGTPEEILQNSELLDFILPTLRADFQLLATYEHRLGQPLNCPVSVFGGQQDRQVGQAHLAGWQAHTTHSLKTRMFSGNHFFIHSAGPQLLRELDQQLGQLLEMAA